MASFAELQAECARLQAENAQSRQTLQQSIDDLQAVLDNLPEDVRAKVAAMAERPQQYTPTEFFRYLKSWLTTNGKEIAATVAMAAFAVYVQIWYSSREPQAAPDPVMSQNHWFYAPAGNGPRVVDEVFREAERRAGQQSRRA